MSGAHLHGSPEVWDEVFAGNDVIYSDTPKTQNQLFEHVKLFFLERIFPKKKNFKMLEVGCGSAFVSLYFAKRGVRVSCVDINEKILAIAKSNFKKQKVGGEFILASAEKLPFEANQFDVITSFGLLEHFEDPTLAISEMARILKKGGMFFADIVPNRFSCQSFGNIFNFIVTFVYWTIKGSPLVGWDKAMRNFKPLYFENSLSWVNYRNIISKAGIKDIKVRGNRPYPRLTLTPALDRLYVRLVKPTVGLWKKFDSWDSEAARFWGAGWWFWGIKNEITRSK